MTATAVQSPRHVAAADSGLVEFTILSTQRSPARWDRSVHSEASVGGDSDDQWTNSNSFADVGCSGPNEKSPLPGNVMDCATSTTDVDASPPYSWQLTTISLAGVSSVAATVSGAEPRSRTVAAQVSVVHSASAPVSRNRLLVRSYRFPPGSLTPITEAVGLLTSTEQMMVSPSVARSANGSVMATTLRAAVLISARWT